jgi:hypothetical protein
MGWWKELAEPDALDGTENLQELLRAPEGALETWVETQRILKCLFFRVCLECSNNQPLQSQPRPAPPTKPSLAKPCRKV